MTAGRLYLIASSDEIVRRRAKTPKGTVVEAWPDVKGVGFWVGAESKVLLDATEDTAVSAELSLPATSVAIYYGPKLCDIDALPRAESLQTRVLSVHGIAVAWVTLDRFGQRNTYEPQSPVDPIFHLRRPGSTRGHLWRLFRTKAEAVVALREMHGQGSEAVEWAQALPVEDFDDLIRQHAQRERP
ncbi:MAG: hypothetical protein ACREKS_06030 [Candidatus Rokuibacteriota bacterium]